MKQNEEEPVVARGQGLSGEPTLFGRDRHERLRAPGGSAASCRGGGGCRRGREVDKRRGYYSKLLFSLLVASVLIATTVVIARNRSRISVRIGASAKFRLAELNCPLFSNSNRGTVSYQGGERRLAAGDTPPVNPDDDGDFEVECAVALGLSLVDGDRTGKRRQQLAFSVSCLVFMPLSRVQREGGCLIVSLFLPHHLCTSHSLRVK